MQTIDMPNDVTIHDLMAPVVAQAQQLDNQPHAFHVKPGRDWPVNLARPPEPVVYIPTPTPKMLKAIPPETLRDMRSYAEQVVKDLGLPPDATLEDLMAGKYAKTPAQQPDEPAEAKTAPRPEKKAPGWKQKLLAPALLATAGIVGQGEVNTLNEQPAPTKAVSTLETIGAEQSKSRHRPTDRKGLTLVEVLVSISIVGVLAALTIPAVQKARDSMYEAAYKNNMRQVGVAIQNFESAHGKFPFATSMVQDARGVAVPHSWVVDILPYIEQGPLHQQYDKTKPYDQQTQEVQNAKIPVLNHPAYPVEPGRMRMAVLSSSGISATNPPDITPQVISRDYLITQQTGDFNVAMPPQWVMNNNNRWQQNSAGTFASITDGTSHTPIVSAHVHEEGDRDPWLAGDTRITGLMFGTQVGQSRVNGGLMGNIYQKDNFVTNHITPSDGRRHTEKHTVLFADGSVRSVGPTGPQGASFFTSGAQRWQEMVTRDDGKTHDDFTP